MPYHYPEFKKFVEEVCVEYDCMPGDVGRMLTFEADHYNYRDPSNSETFKQWILNDAIRRIRIWITEPRCQLDPITLAAYRQSYIYFHTILPKKRTAPAEKTIGTLYQIILSIKRRCRKQKVEIVEFKKIIIVDNLECAKEIYNDCKNDLESYTQISGYFGSVSLFIPAIQNDGQIGCHPFDEETYIERVVKDN